MHVDKENRGWSLLRYQVIFCSKNMQDMFEDEDLKKEIREVIFSFFTSMKTVEIVSIFIYSYYVAIDFQALPTVAPSDIVSSLKSSTSKKILKNNPEIKSKYAGLWNNSYFLTTSDQSVDQHRKDYLNRQFELRSIKKVVSK